MVNIPFLALVVIFITSVSAVVLCLYGLYHIQRVARETSGAFHILSIAFNEIIARLKKLESKLKEYESNE